MQKSTPLGEPVRTCRVLARVMLVKTTKLPRSVPCENPAKWEQIGSLQADLGRGDEQMILLSMILVNSTKPQFIGSLATIHYQS